MRVKFGVRGFEFGVFPSLRLSKSLLLFPLASLPFSKLSLREPAPISRRGTTACPDSSGKQSPSVNSDCFSSHKPSFAMTTSLRSSRFHISSSPFSKSSLRGGTTKQSLLLILFLFLSISANAKILLPQILSNDMVLQRNKPINIWGFASPNEKVEVTFAGQNKKTVTDKNGNWKVVLTP